MTSNEGEVVLNVELDEESVAVIVCEPAVAKVTLTTATPF